LNEFSADVSCGIGPSRQVNLAAEAIIVMVAGASFNNNPAAMQLELIRRIFRLKTMFTGRAGSVSDRSKTLKSLNYRPSLWWEKVNSIPVADAGADQTIDGSRITIVYFKSLHQPREIQVGEFSEEYHCFNVVCYRRLDLIIEVS